MLKIMLNAAVFLGLAGSAYAHEFSVTFLVPAGSEISARQGFLLASAERDSHANETSEGHLGGVDSQLEIIVEGQAVSPSDVLVAIGGGPLPGTLAAEDLWRFQLATVSGKARAEFLDAAVPFAARYSARYGGPPGEIATLVYIAARLIDLAVRPQDGVHDIMALENAIRNY